MFIEAAINDIDEKAGQIRASYITVAPGQESAYLLKADEARRLLADQDPVMTAYPMIALESSALGQDPLDTASEILLKADQWQFMSGLIESKRLYWKRKVKEADNYDAVYMFYMTAMRELEELRG